MADAFGNVWPQYQRGHQQMYRPQAAGRAQTVRQAPFIGQPIGADAGFDAGGGGTGDVGGGGSWDPNATINPAAGAYGYEAYATGADPNEVYSPQVRRATLVRMPGDIAGPDTPPAQVYRPVAATTNTGNVPGPDTPPNEVYNPPAVEGGPPPGTFLNPATGSYEPLHQGGQPVHPAHPIVRRAQPVLTRGAYTYPAGVVPRAQPVLTNGAYTFPAAQTASQPGLGQRFLQSLGHLFAGTLGQHGQPQAGQNTWTQSGQNPWSGQSVSAWIAGRKAQEAANKSQVQKLKQGGSGGTSGQAPFMGQPLGAGGGFPGSGNYGYSDAPQSDPSALSGSGGEQDTAALASSGGGEPQTRYRMGPFDPGLTKTGGFTGSWGAGLAPLQSLVGGGGGDGGGGGGKGGGLAGMGGGGGSGTGMNTMTGSGATTGQLAGAASGALQAFGKLEQDVNAPVSVNPALWANAPPNPATFQWPQLSQNVGGQAPWA